jgi:hypothetical protein
MITIYKCIQFCYMKTTVEHMLKKINYQRCALEQYWWPKWLVNQTRGSTIPWLFTSIRNSKKENETPYAYDTKRQSKGKLTPLICSHDLDISLWQASAWAFSPFPWKIQFEKLWQIDGINYMVICAFLISTVSLSIKNGKKIKLTTDYDKSNYCNSIRQ